MRHLSRILFPLLLLAIPESFNVVLPFPVAVVKQTAHGQ